MMNGDIESRQEINLLRRNISQITSRLEGDFQEYRDITTPVVGFISCLDIGLSLACSHDSYSVSAPNTMKPPYQSLPLAGGIPADVLSDKENDTQSWTFE